jgi:hypothetical protein
MPLIALSELKAVLGIGDIYADAIVQAVRRFCRKHNFVLPNF